MRFAIEATVIALCAGVTLFAGAANAQRLDDSFELLDENDPNRNQAGLVVVGTTYFISGFVEGTGTDGDFVLIGYATDLPTKAKADDRKVEVAQSRASSLIFVIESDVPERNLELDVNPDKCKIDGGLNVNSEKGAVVVNCTAENIFSEISASQEESIAAAFQDNPRVKVKVKSDGSKGSIAIKLKGFIAEET
jgi:hypothetical protein